MKSAVWISLSVLAVAAMIFLPMSSGFQRSRFGAEGSSQAGSINPSEVSATPTPVARIETLQILPSKDDIPVAPQPPDQRPSVDKDPFDLASSYAESLQTGVFGDEPMPRFAEMFLFPTEAAREAAGAAQEEFLGSPIDQWSSRMEEQLRTAFGRHPFASNVRVSTTCRATQCKIQFVEPTVRVQPPGELGPNSLMMILNVAREAWFRENFSEWKTQAATPVTAEVAYQLVVLPRRPAQQ